MDLYLRAWHKAPETCSVPGVLIALVVGLACVFPLAAQEKPAAPGIAFVAIAPGEFLMGCSVGDKLCAEDERPAHLVKITRKLEIGKYLVTQAQWQAVMGKNPSFFSGADLPVDSVNWNDAQAFIQRLNAANDGYHYRLPTEAEWEYAARAGTKKAYVGTPATTAWFGVNSGGKTHPVGQREPNAWGIYDMFGNVWEWVDDFYSPTYYSTSPPADPAGPPEASPAGASRLRELRGGAWGSNKSELRASRRNRTILTDVANFRGFRVAREAVR